VGGANGCVQEWGAHVRRHVDVDGYWVCENGDEDMNTKLECRVKECCGIHS
jgi:hypothetical protein